MPNAWCKVCNAMKDMMDTTVFEEGKKTTTTGKCETCDNPLKLTAIDMFKR